MERRGSLIYFLLYVRQGKGPVKMLGCGGWGVGGGPSCRFTVYITFKAGRPDPSAAAEASGDGAGVLVGAKVSAYRVSPPRDKVRGTPLNSCKKPVGGQPKRFNDILSPSGNKESVSVIHTEVYKLPGATAIKPWTTSRDSDSK